MKILLFGKTGQVAREIQRRAGSNVQLDVLGRDLVDFTDPETCSAHVIASDADAIINAVAYTAVDLAEEDEGTAMLVNAAAPTAIARAAAARRLPLVHISTDYVFDGSGQVPFAPSDPAHPLSAYGRSKLAGEEGVRDAGGTHVILRTSWVISAHGSNFIKTMLRLGAERKQLTIVSDQIGGPTCAADIANVCLALSRQLIAAPCKSGTYHYSGKPDVSWADLARKIFMQSGLACQVEDIPSSAYPTLARRPMNSRLDCSTTETTFGIARPDWGAGLTTILSELGAPRT